MRAEEAALYECLESGDFPETIEELVVKNKIDLNDCFKESYTPLMVAAQNGHVNAARKLIDLGAKANTATSDGDTALIEAAYNDRLEVMMMLIQKGVDINFADDDNYTALMWASSAGHHAACTLLLKAGADVTVASKEGYSCVDLAMAGGFLNLARKLTAAGGKPQRSKKLENKKQNTEGVEEDDEGGEEDRLDEVGEEDVLYLINEGVEEEEEESSDSDEEEEESEEPEETWLAPILAECGTPAHLIYLCEEQLVRQEGFGCAQTLARTPTSLFHRAYLESLGIRGLGLQQVLLDYHADLHHDYVQEKRHQQQSQTGGTVKSQPHAVAQQHQQQQGSQGATVSKQTAKPHKEHRQSKDRSGGSGGGGTTQQLSEPHLSTVKSAKKRAHQDSLQHLEGSPATTATAAAGGGGGESPTAGTGTAASANTTPGSSNKRQAVTAHHADG